MKKVLYCNLRESWTIAGHKYFDVKWANLLSNISEVTLLWPNETWYSNVNENVQKEVFNSKSLIKENKIINCPIWNKGLLRHLNLKSHIEATIIIRKVIELDQIHNFDFIIISTMDFIAFDFMKHYLKLEKLYVIQHQCSAYEKKTWGFFFNHFKNHIHHIVMESDGVDYLQKKYKIDNTRINYIPHMLNPVEEIKSETLKPYDIVGISNSNDDLEIQKIIQLDISEDFFKKHNINAIFRSTTLEYKSDYLTVFTGRLSLSFEDYYYYIKYAKLIILPFPNTFGLRSSGTIMDAFSNGIPIIGTAFSTMIQYKRKYPHICMTYNTEEELKHIISDVMKRKEQYQDEYWQFCKEHSNEVILQKLCNMLDL